MGDLPVPPTDKIANADQWKIEMCGFEVFLIKQPVADKNDNP
jgi:hypothetical protein